MAYRRSGYWYKSRRSGHRVETEYLGAGILGEFAAVMDAEEQERRRKEREAIDVERQAQAAIDRPLDAVEAELRHLVGQVLRNAGYHQHKGTWRRRRDGHKTGKRRGSGDHD
jgi:hypothetical protein